MWERAVFGAFTAYAVQQQQFFSAVVLTFCIAICSFLSNYPLDKANPLPSREDFRTLVDNLSAGEAAKDEECPICYDVLDDPARLPCGRHYLCHDCVERLYGSKHQTDRCPICRVPLFKTRAPWDSIPMKFLICQVAVAFIAHITKLAVLVLEYTPGHPIYHTLKLLSTCGLFFYPWVLVRMYCNMSYEGLEYWTWWTTGAVGNGFLLFWPVTWLSLWQDTLQIQEDMLFVLPRTFFSSWHEEVVKHG